MSEGAGGGEGGRKRKRGENWEKYGRMEKEKNFARAKHVAPRREEGDKGGGLTPTPPTPPAPNPLSNPSIMLLSVCPVLHGSTSCY